MPYETILVEPDPPIAVVRLNRPKVLNALNSTVIAELVDALENLDRDPAVRCIILTGNERAFAAGADISEMADLTIADQLQRDQFAAWDRIRRVRKPLIAAVSGYALGGGCEVALMCDLIVASETARFGQPEINLGIIPGWGGTQRLTRQIGVARAMEIILTGDMLDAAEAYRLGLVNKVVEPDKVLDEALALAAKIVSKGGLAIGASVKAIHEGLHMPLADGLKLEVDEMVALLGSNDAREGFSAFVEKRAPKFGDS